MTSDGLLRTSRATASGGEISRRAQILLLPAVAALVLIVGLALVGPGAGCVFRQPWRYARTSGVAERTPGRLHTATCRCTCPIRTWDSCDICQVDKP